MNTSERFWSKVQVGTPEECWLWTKGMSGDYGVLKVAGHVIRAHAWALAEATGAWGECALHSCDNPPCVNPRHLRWGSRVDNGHDVAIRHRKAGVRQWSNKLTAPDVLSIRARHEAGERVKALSIEYNVTMSSISNIIARRKWTHI